MDRAREESYAQLEEMVKMVVCALDLENEVKADSSDWSKGYMDVAGSKGILSSVVGTKGTYVTRGDVAVMVNNGLNMETEKVETPTTPTTPTTPADTYEETYTVTFIEDVETGVEYLSLTVKEGEVIEAPADPIKEGYEFAGWYADEMGIEAFDFSEPIFADTTVYANWLQEEFFDDDLYAEEIPEYDEFGNPIVPEYDEFGNPILP